MDMKLFQRKCLLLKATGSHGSSFVQRSEETKQKIVFIKAHADYYLNQCSDAQWA